MAKINFKEKKSIWKKIGKKNMVVMCAILVIGVAVYLNYMFFYTPTVQTPTEDGTQSEAPVEQTPTDNYFTATQLSRQMARDEALEVLADVLANESALESTKNEALEEMARIAKDIETESRIETLITAKGFEDCLAVMNNDKISIIVKCDEELKQNQLTQINEIVYTEAGISPTNVKIIQK